MNYRTQYPDWDEALQHLGGSFLQSTKWAEFQESIGRHAVWGKDEGWMWLAAVRGQKGLKYLLCSYGPTAKDEASMNEALESLVQAGRELGCDFVRVEPQRNVGAGVLRALGGRAISEVQPAHTQIIDLRQSVEDFRKGLASGHRNLINGTERRGISIRQSNAGKDLELLLAMLHETAKRAGVTFYPDSYYRALVKELEPACQLYLAEANGQPVAAALFYDWAGTRYYAHAGAFQDLNRKVNASVSLVWQAMMDAKEAGLEAFDLWGIAPDDNPKHSYAGITKFKKGFGGKQVDYAGTWDIPLHKAKYAAYSAYRKLKGRDS